MKVFYTPSVQHLVPLMGQVAGAYTLRIFNDGELFVRLEEDVTNQEVFVFAATNAPTRHFVQLFFLLDALQQQTTKINLVFTYFGYQRQDHPKQSVARAAYVMSNCFRQFSLNKIYIVHPHSVFLHDYINFEVVMPYCVYFPFIRQLAPQVIIAPDRGALPVCEYIAQQVGATVGFVDKERRAADVINVQALHADVNDKDVLIFDDIISTGNTIAQAAQVLHANGARRIHVLATHNLLNARALQRIEQSSIEHVWVSNTLPSTCTCERLSTLDISSVFKSLFV